jgi:hypothetical protein
MNPLLAQDTKTPPNDDHNAGDAGDAGDNSNRRGKNFDGGEIFESMSTML